jgi:hypothetical protein
MEDNGITIGAHEKFGRTDVVATHPSHGTVLIECEADANRQREQAEGTGHVFGARSTPSENGWRGAPIWVGSSGFL